MTEQTECRWSWCNPDKPGLWWYGRGGSSPNPLHILHVSECTIYNEGWWAYVGPTSPEPLPPKRKVTQTLWMVPTCMSVNVDGDIYHYPRWLSADDTIPPGAIETVLKREVEL